MIDIHLRLPDEIEQVIRTYAKKTGMSINSINYNALFWYFYTKGLIEWVKIPITTEKNIVKNEITVTPPEGAMYCDSDKCELPPLVQQC